VNDRRVERLLERLVIAVERLAQIPSPKRKPAGSVAGLAHTSRRETYTNDGFTQGGTDPAEFFARHPHERD